MKAAIRSTTGGDDDPRGPLLSACVNDHVELWETKVKPKTLAQHELMLSRLQDFFEKRHKYHARDLTVDLLEKFKTSGLTMIKEESSRGTAWNKILCFVGECHRRGWITEPLHLKLESHKFTVKPGDPFKDDELPIVFDAALHMNGGIHGYASQPKTFWCLLKLLETCGLRAGDGANFDPSLLRRTKNEGQWVYKFEMQKKRRDSKTVTIVEQFLPDWLKREIDECNWLSPKRPFAWPTSDNNPHHHAQQIYERMQQMGEVYDISDCRPHRLRHTYAVRMILAGKSVDDVAILLGHKDPGITRQCYLKWIESMSDRLSDVVANAIANPGPYRI